MKNEITKMCSTTKKECLCCWCNYNCGPCHTHTDEEEAALDYTKCQVEKCGGHEPREGDDLPGRAY